MSEIATIGQALAKNKLGQTLRLHLIAPHTFD